MASKRKQAARAKRLARRQSQTKPGGASKYALKRRRFLAGWDNPRSPIRVSEREVIWLPGTLTPAELAYTDIASVALEAAGGAE